jgi:hypothetical protein
MDPYDRFHDLLKRDFAPLLRSEGFKGSGTTFRRITGEVIHVVNIQGSKYGGQCCVNLGLHYSFLPTAGGDGVADPKKLLESQCDFRDRVHASHESDHWWSYGTTVAESEASIADLLDAYRRRGASFFKKFEPFPAVFEKITPPYIVPYAWQAKAANGAIALSGYAPSEDIRTGLFGVAKKAFAKSAPKDATVAPKTIRPS